MKIVTMGVSVSPRLEPVTVKRKSVITVFGEVIENHLGPVPSLRTIAPLCKKNPMRELPAELVRLSPPSLNANASREVDSPV